MERNYQFSVTDVGVTCQPVEFGQLNNVKVTLIRGDLPKVRFQWIPQCYIGEIPATALAKMAGDYPRAGIRPPRKGEERGSMWVAPLTKGGDVAVETVTFCNFRRYGWSWTYSPSGERGYGGGPTWPNGDMGPLTSESGDQLIRDTLVMAIEALPVPRHAKYGPQIRTLWDWILADALTHKWGGGGDESYPSRAARLSQDHTFDGTAQVNRVEVSM